MSIFWDFWHFLVVKNLMTYAYEKWRQHCFYHRHALNTLSSNTIKLYCFWISSAWNIKGDKIVQPAHTHTHTHTHTHARTEKSTFKKPSIIRFNVLKENITDLKNYSKICYIHYIQTTKRDGDHTFVCLLRYPWS